MLDSLALIAAALPEAAGTVTESEPAGGAELRQIVIGGVASTAWFALMAVLGLRHRSGKSRVLSTAGGLLSRLTGLPPWVALPNLVAVIALAVAGVGFVWDVSLHLDNGRDAGPFANPSHYMLIVGTTLFVTSGWLAIAMPLGRAVRGSAVRIANDWWAPAGGVAMFGCGVMSLSGFVLDDVWHRLFGQDVTLWGPTHLMMITGGLLVLFGTMALINEGIVAARADAAERAGGAAGDHRRRRYPFAYAQKLVVAGAVLTGLTIAYQQEFSYGMPQFNLIYHPVLIAMSAALALVSARLSLGRGGALATMVVAAAINGLLTLLVGPVFGEITLHFPLYAAEAVLVELAALAFLRRGAGPFAVASGVAIATLGVGAEWLWSRAWMPIEWPAHLLPEMIAWSLPVAVAASLIGAFVASTLAKTAEGAATGPRRIKVASASLAVVGVVLGALLVTTAPKGISADVVLTEVPSSAGRTVHATVEFDPPSVAENANWLLGFGWQGDSLAIQGPLREIAPGKWRTTVPLPVHGTWKTAIRWHRGTDMASIPIHMPADSALGLPELAAPPRFTRELQGDRELMQRERRDDVPGWLFALGSSLVALLTALSIVLVAWALRRAAHSKNQLPSDGHGGATQRSRARPEVAIA